MVLGMVPMLLNILACKLTYRALPEGLFDDDPALLGPLSLRELICLALGLVFIAVGSWLGVTGKPVSIMRQHEQQRGTQVAGAGQMRLGNSRRLDGLAVSKHAAYTVRMRSSTSLSVRVIGMRWPSARIAM